MRSFHGIREFVRNAFVSRPPDPIGAAGFTLLLVFVAIAPWLYGGAPENLRTNLGAGGILPLGNLVLTIFAFIIAAAAVLSKAPGVSLGGVGVPLGALAGIALLGLVQLLPLPEAALRKLFPVNQRIYHEMSEILRIFGKTDVPRPRISIAPSETAGVVLLLLAYLALFVGAALLCHNRTKRRLLFGTLLTGAALQVFVAAFLERGTDRVRGPFANPNHFAGYLEIALALALGALWAEVLTGSDRTEGITDPGERLEKRLRPLAGRVLLWGGLAAGIGLTKSRGAILAAAVTTLLLLTMALLGERTRSRKRVPVRAAALAGFLLAGLLLVAAALSGRPLQRFFDFDPLQIRGNARVALWGVSLAAWREFPIAGSGLGTFREAFRRVQPRDMRGLVEQAHNELLQLLVTGGVLGAFLGTLAFVSLFVLLFRAWRRQKHREESAFVLAGFGALLSLTLHGLVEFNMSIPIIPATLACVLGGAWAAGRRNEGVHR